MNVVIPGSKMIVHLVQKAVAPASVVASSDFKWNYIPPKQPKYRK